MAQTTNDIKNGSVLNLDGQLWTVMKFQHVKPGKGPAFVRTTIKNVLSGKIVDKTFNAGMKMEFETVDNRTLQYSYEDGDNFVFMDMTTYDQMHMDAEATDGKANYLKDGQECRVLLYNEKPLDIEIPKGRLTVVTGVSGSGKTTIGRAIMRILPTSGGEVLYKGQKINGKISRQLDQQVIKEIQMIFQDPQSSLNERAKVSYIVGEGLQNVRPDLTAAQREEKVRQALLDVGLLPEFASRFPHEFSGGQRQRIGIARALIVEPEFIIADEPISALDMSIRAQVLNLLLELQEERKLSYLFIAHDLAVVKHISDRVAVMYLGKIVEMSDAETIYQSPKHAYTKALLDAIPEPDPSRANKHQPLPGDVPSPINPPLGSAFGHRIQHPSYPETVGADLTPVEIEPGHWVAPDPCALEPEDWNRIRQR